MKLLTIGSKCKDTGVHPCREWFPAFNYSFTKDYLEKSFEVEQLPALSKPGQHGSHISYELFGRKIKLPLNSFLIANKQTERYVLITSFWDLSQISGATCNLDFEKMITTFSGHYTQGIVDVECHEFSHKFKPWYFRTWRPDYGRNNYYNKTYAPDIDKLYFRGVFIHGRRDFVKALEKAKLINPVSGLPEIDASCKKVSWDNHEKECERSRVCLSAPGIRDMCNRDVEYWKAGIPFIRPRFTSELVVDIPDDVYFPINHKPYFHAGRRKFNEIEDPQLMASLVIEKYQEIKSNQKLLDNVSKAGLDFYQKYFTYDSIAKNTFTMLEESGLFDEE